MRNVSAAYKAAITNPEYTKRGYYVVGDKTYYPNTFTSLSVTYPFNETFTIGSFEASSVEIEVLNTEITASYSEQTIVPYLGTYTSEEKWEYLKMGVFKVPPNGISKTGSYTKITGYDAAYYMTKDYSYLLSEKGNATLDVVISDIASSAGIEVSEMPSAASSIVLITDITGTQQEAVQQMALLLGCNARIDSDGKLAFYKPDFSNPKLTCDFSQAEESGFVLNGEGLCLVDGVKVNVSTQGNDESEDSEATEYVFTSGNCTGTVLEVENSNLYSQTMVDAFAHRIGVDVGVKYWGYSLSLIDGRPELEPGDVISYTDSRGKTYPLGAFNLTHTYDGGIKTTLTASAYDSIKSESISNTAPGGISKQLSDTTAIAQSSLRLEIHVTGNTYKAVVYRGDGDVTSEFKTNQFQWFLKNENATTDKGTGYSVEINTDSAGYGSVVRCEFTY